MLGHFGETIRTLREARGQSERDIARAFGRSLTEWREFERAPELPDPRLLAALSAHFGQSPDELTLRAGSVPDSVRAALAQHPARALWALSCLLPSEPAAPRAVLPPPVVETGLGRLHQVDALDLLRAQDDASVDLVFADPPFNLSKDYGEACDDALGERAYLDWSRQWLTESARVLAPGGSLFVYNLPRWNLSLGAWLAERLTFRNWIAVEFKSSLPIAGRLYPSHYSLLWFTRGRPTTFDPDRLPLATCRHCGGELRDYGGYKDRMNPRGVNLSDVWTDISPVRHRRHKRRTGANELPLRMLDRVLSMASRPGDLILDPFGGSGTTYVAAELTGRRWLGSELGDCSPVTQRFADLDRERAHLDLIRAKLNTLFTGDALALRERHGHDNGAFRVDASAS